MLFVHQFCQINRIRPNRLFFALEDKFELSTSELTLLLQKDTAYDLVTGLVPQLVTFQSDEYLPVWETLGFLFVSFEIVWVLNSDGVFGFRFFSFVYAIINFSGSYLPNVPVESPTLNHFQLISKLQIIL